MQLKNQHNSGKTFIFFTLIILFCTPLRSQNWDLFSANNIYNYKSNKETYYSVKIDSTIENVSYLNKHVIFCDTCKANLGTSSNSILIPCDSCYYSKINSIFFNANTITDNFSYHKISGKNNCYLPKNPSLYVPFIFDSLNNISGILISKSIIFCNGSTDSAKTYILGLNDTLIISKNHGIYKMPVNYNDREQYLIQTGIKGVTNSGLNFPGFNEIYNFNVGDVFQYKWKYNIFYTSPPIYSNGIKKIKVLTKKVLPDTIIYTFDIVENKNYLVGVSGNFTFTSSQYTAEEYFIDSTKHSARPLPGEFISYNHFLHWQLNDNFLGNIVIGFVDTLGNGGKYFGIPKCGDVYKNELGSLWQLDSLPDKYLKNADEMIYTKVFKEGLGETEHSYRYGERYYTHCLIGYSRSGIACGTIYSDENILLNVEKNSAGNFRVFPNPANNYIIINNNERINGTIKIFNIFGELILSQKVDKAYEISINTCKFANGFYEIILQDSKDQYYQKMLISH